MGTTTKKLRAKCIETMLDCSQSTAYRVLKDIKEHFNIKTVLLAHFNQYYRIN